METQQIFWGSAGYFWFIKYFILWTLNTLVSDVEMSSVRQVNSSKNSQQSFPQTTAAKSLPVEDEVDQILNKTDGLVTRKKNPLL